MNKIAAIIADILSILFLVIGIITDNVEFIGYFIPFQIVRMGFNINKAVVNLKNKNYSL